MPNRLVVPMRETVNEKPPCWAINTWACPDLETARKRGVQAGMAVDFNCPNGHIGILRCHQIKPNGDVEPSVVCPEACGFHEHIHLEGWAEEKP